MWTGDNSATWGHLKIAAPMLLSINLGGLSFAGADVGGFFGEPGAELFTRWYQAGAFTPFFRGHAHHDTKRREPWVFGEPYTTVLRDAAMLRYTLLPLWYTVFFEGYETGMPVMRPMFMEFPDDHTTFKMDDQWMVGGALLVKPVTDKGANSVQVYLPGSEDWYDLHTLARVPANAEGTTTKYPAPLGVIPVFIRPGTVLPRKMRLRRSSKLMFYDPYTLVIAPDSAGRAAGSLYIDDEHSLAHEATSQFAVRSFTYISAQSSAVLTCAAAARPEGASSPSAAFADTVVNTVERIVIAGQRYRPFAVNLSAEEGSDATPLSYIYDEDEGTLTIKKPNSRIVEDWVITVDYAKQNI
jgi:alpha 1,3-glucosidase